MARVNIPIGFIYLGIAVLFYIKPEHKPFNSYIGSVVVLSSIATALKIFYNLSLYPRFFTPLKRLPTPPNRTWLRGNTTSLFLETPFPHMAEWIKSVPNEGLIRYYMIGNLERVLLTTPKALSEVLVHKVYEFQKPELVQLQLQRVTGWGILLAEGNEHKVQRKNLMPAFSYRHIKELYPIFWSKSVEMVTGIEKAINDKQGPDGNVVQISNWASRATLDIIGLAGMDHDFDSLRDPNNELNQHYRRMLVEPTLVMKLVLLLGLFVINIGFLQKLPLSHNKVFAESSQAIRGVARQMIREKKEKLENKTPTSTDGVDIISIALRSGTFTEENLIDQMMTFLAAGHETTSTALQWAVYALSKHPDVQTRLREEIRANLPSISSENPDSISAAAIDNLPYLNAVCNEILRFHPSVPATVRAASRDTSISGVPIPKGTFVLIVPEVINHDKELWGPDADKFNPERWLGPGRANSGGADSNYAFLTFLHGSRSCIGQGFARAEMACLVAAMVGKFRMELKYPDKKLEVRQTATICPKDGVLAKLTPLEGW